MLSYQHIYHAGNRGDVLKHAILAQALADLAQTSTGIAYFESHAGRGLYRLTAPEAQKIREYESGIVVVREEVERGSPFHTLLAPYLDIVDGLNGSRSLRLYPGSPGIAAAMLDEEDRILLCELHPGEVQHLEQALGRDNRVRILAEDGFAKLGTLAAAAPRSLCVTIDPSYEIREDYEDVLWAADWLLTHPERPLGLVWYPILGDGRVDALRQEFRTLSRHAHVIEAHWPPADPSRPGMIGAGVALIHPSANLLAQSKLIAEGLTRLFRR